MKKFLILVYVILSSSFSKGDSITINPNETPQIIDGFGASVCDPFNILMHNPKYYDAADKTNTAVGDELFDLLFSREKGVGLTVFRVNINNWTSNSIWRPMSHEPRKGEWNFDTTDQFQNWAMKEAAKRNVRRFFALPWSPPAWMKENNSPMATHKESTYPFVKETDNVLKKECYQDFAEYLMRYIVEKQKRDGIHIGWINLQNECQYDGERRPACYYAPEKYKEVLPVAGKMFRDNYVDTIFSLPETSRITQAIPYLRIILSDEECRKYAGLISMHGYNRFDDVIGQMDQFKLKKWQTETSFGTTMAKGDFRRDWNFAIGRIVEHLHGFLTKGNFSGWLTWWLIKTGNEKGGQPKGLINAYDDGTYEPLKRLYVIGQYSKFIRPGYVRIGAAAPSKQLLVSAYRHPAGGRTVVVIANTSDDPITSEIAGVPDNAKFSVYRTSMKESLLFINGL